MTTPYTVERDGKVYMYRATSHYSPEKRGPVAETEYMGVVIDGKLKPKRGYFYNEETGEFGPVDVASTVPSGHMKLRTLRFGDVYFLMSLQKRLNILDDLEVSFGKEMGRTIMAVCFAYTIEPSALMHMESVIERRYIREILEIPRDTDFSSPRMSELTRLIGESTGGTDEFFRRRITGTDGEYLFDLTSESTYSVKNPNAEWGRNKDGQKLKQINLGLVTDRIGRPLAFFIYPGSVADVTTVRRMAGDVKRLGGKDATLVLDRGFVSTKSVHTLMDDGTDFVVPMIMGDNKVTKSLVTAILEVVGRVENTKVHHGRSYTVLERQIAVRRCVDANRRERETVWDDPDGYEMLLDTDEDFASCEHMLDVFVFRDTESAGYEIARMDVALQMIIEGLEGSKPRDPNAAFLKAAGDYASKLKWELDDEKRMHVEVRQNAHSFAANRKGMFIMITPSSSERSWDNVLDCYECRDLIEDTFLEDKSEGDGRRPRSGDRDTVFGRTFIRMVSMIMTMEILHRISEYSEDRKIPARNKPRDIAKRTPRSLLGSLSNIDIIEGEGWREMTEVTRDNKLIFKMFDIGPPKGITR